MYSFNRLVTHWPFLQSSRGGPTQGGCSIFDCGVSVSVLSVGFWVGDGRRLLDAAPVHVLRVLRRPEARAPGPLLPLLRPVALYTLDMGRDR